ncbi:MAG TPA: hypothetical protein VFK05_23290 [Polyangiaceae bacterium]|nr:hypothetical protein [Polyangiaceae bacterium]
MPVFRDRAAKLVALALQALGVALFLASAGLSYRRHLHIDELSGLYAIQLGAAFGHPEYGTIELSSVLFRPLALWLASSERLFVGFRMVELALLFGVCWSVAQVQRSLPHALGRGAVFFAAVSFGPLWRHGFEVRHDIFVAYAIVLLAWAAERAQSGRLELWSASLTGLGVILTQANSSKAFTLWLPGLALCAWFAARGQRPWLKRFVGASLRFVPGILLGSALVAAVFAATGMLSEYWQQLRQFTNFSSAPPYRLSALPLLTFAVMRAPVHAAFVLLGLLSVARRASTRQPLDEAWVPLFVFVLSVVSISLNPTPFPYNLTWLTPAWLLMASFGFSRALSAIAELRQGSTLSSALGVACAALALVCFWNCEQDPYYRKSWDRQLRVVAAAEALTGPDDPVLDLCGLVVSRPPVAKDWIVHSLYMPAYHAGRRETVRHIIERVFPPVAISVYRWSFLDRADWLGFRRNYSRFSDDVWVLARVLAPGSSSVEIPRSGRYRVQASGAAGRIDGRALRGGDVLFLERGPHEVFTETGYTLIWNGPREPGEPPPSALPLFEPGELPRQRDLH